MRDDSPPALAGLALAAGATFVLLSVAYDAAPLLDLDTRIAGWARSLPAWVEPPARALDAFGGHAVLPAIAVLGIGWLVYSRRLQAAALVVVAAVGADVLVHGGRVLYEPTRDAAGVDLPAEARFPSGHATTAIAIYGALAVVLTRGQSLSARILALTSSLLFATAVGSSRVLLDDKSATDVAAGVVLGVFWLATCIAVAGRARRRARAAATP